MTELSFKQQKKLVDIATITANKLADWSFLEEVKVDNEFMKHFEFMVKEILIGILYYKYGRKAEIMSKIEEIKTAKSETVREFLERLKEKAVWDDKGDTKIVYEYDIDKIAKEMMMGNNAE